MGVSVVWIWVASPGRLVKRASASNYFPPSFRLPNPSKLGQRFRFFFPFRSTFAYINVRRAGGRPFLEGPDQAAANLALDRVAHARSRREGHVEQGGVDVAEVHFHESLLDDIR